MKSTVEPQSIPATLRLGVSHMTPGRYTAALKIVTLFNINVSSCRINVPPCQMNYPPSQINVPQCQKNVPLSNNFPKFLRKNHDLRDIYLQEGHIFVFLFDHVYGPYSSITTPQKVSSN